MCAFIGDVSQMESEDPNEREFACGALANIVADDQVTQKVLPLLMRLDIVRMTTKCLSDAELNVCAEAAGLLKYVFAFLYIHHGIYCLVRCIRYVSIL